MKIVDYNKQGIFMSIAALVIILGGTVSRFQQSGLEGEGSWKWLVFAAIAVVSIVYNGCYGWHHYILGPTGIDYSGLFGLRKHHFDWYEMRSFALCTVSAGAKRGDYPVIVLAKQEPSELNLPGYGASAIWYWKRHKDIVMFRFNPLRYEYVRQYCNAAVMDMR